MSHQKKRNGNVNGNGKRLDSEAYNFIFETATEISEEVTEASKSFPREKLSLANQVCRHSMLVCINLEEAWRMKEHKTLFLGKLSEAAQAASKTQDCLEFASKYNYIGREIFKKIDAKYEDIFEDIFIMLCGDDLSMDNLENNDELGGLLVRKTVI